MLTIDELQVEIDTDCKINRADVAGEILRATSLLAKYLKYHHQYKAAMIRGESILNEKVWEAALYYDGKAEAKVYKERGVYQYTLTNQDQRNKAIDADPICCEYREKVDTAEECRSMCATMIEHLKYRPKHLETVFEVRRFESGD